MALVDFPIGCHLTNLFYLIVEKITNFWCHFRIVFVDKALHIGFTREIFAIYPNIASFDRGSFGIRYFG